MKYACSKVAVYLSVALVSVMAHAQGSFVLTNTQSHVGHTFTNSSGTASLVNGMIVFEGELKCANLPVPSAPDNFSHVLASLQLLAQVKLFDVLPTAGEVGSAQGAVAARKDSPTATTGKYFAWGVVNNVPDWVPLMMADSGPQFAVSEGETNYITFVFNYTVPAAATYQVFISDVSPMQLLPSEPVASSTAATGIAGVSLLGVGGLTQVASISGAPGPLSSSVGFSVYATSKGILLILDPKDEQGTEGWFIVMAKINGEWVEVGRVQANGSGHYEFYASSALAVGQAYEFKVIDEINNVHTLSQPVMVKTIKMDSVVMNAEVMLVTFNSEPGRSYQVLVAESPNAAVWTPAVVYYPVQGGWGYDSGAFTVAGDSTTIKIPRNEGAMPKAFFKIIKTN